jgi:hypothetical protein
LTASAFSYASIEAALASLLQDANGFVSFIAGNTPQQLLRDILGILALPVELPVFAISELIVFYLLYTGQIMPKPLFPNTLLP